MSTFKAKIQQKSVIKPSLWTQLDKETYAVKAGQKRNMPNDQPRKRAEMDQSNFAGIDKEPRGK